MKNDVVGSGRVAGRDLLLPVKVHAIFDHRRFENLRDLLVEERHQAVTTIDQVHLDPERGEGAGIFAANDAAADDDELLRHRLELEDLVGIVDAVVVERELRRPEGRGAGGDEDPVAAEQDFPVAGVDAHGVRVDEAARTANSRHAALIEPRLDAGAVRRSDIVGVPHEIADRRFALERKIDAVQLP